MDIRLIRRQNLAALIAEAGSVAELARRTGVSEKYLRQILGGYKGSDHKSAREIGHSIARRIETGMKRRPGWLDTNVESAAGHSRPAEEPTPSYSADEYEILALWRVLFQDQRDELMAKLRGEADRAARIEAELRKRNLDKAVPDGEVAKHLPARPAQRELPIAGASTVKKAGKR